MLVLIAIILFFAFENPIIPFAKPHHPLRPSTFVLQTISDSTETLIVLDLKNRKSLMCVYVYTTFPISLNSRLIIFENQCAINKYNQL